MFNRDLLAIIQDLSDRDPKSLSQKGLKLAEEVGELAKKILPLENAAGTTHRFVQKTDLLEECADNVLVVLSIVRNLGFTMADLEAMVAHKVIKWDGLLKKESKVKYPCPFEIHITVRGTDVERFRTACAEVGVKPILIDAQTRAGESLFLDMQTTQVHMGVNTSAYDAMKATAAGLRERGFEVVREKIETVPWHPAAPSTGGGVATMPPNCYFESHVAVVIPEGDRPKVKEVAEAHKAHLSRNASKRLDGGNVKLMITYRSYTDARETFEKAVEALVKGLGDAAIAYEKPIIEFSVFDSKISHDASWIGR